MIRGSPASERDRADRGRVREVAVRQAEVGPVEDVEHVPAQDRPDPARDVDPPLQAEVEALPVRAAQLVAQLVAEGARRHGLERRRVEPAHDRRAVGRRLQLRSTPLSGSPTWLGRPVMFVPTLLPLWLTVYGRPERQAKMPDSVQPPRMALADAGLRPALALAERQLGHEVRGQAVAHVVVARSVPVAEVARLLREGVRALGGELLRGVVLRVAERVGDAEAVAVGEALLEADVEALVLRLAVLGAPLDEAEVRVGQRAARVVARPRSAAAG